MDRANDKMKIDGEQLRRLMIQAGHDSKSLADAIGVKKQAVSNWLNGQNSISAVHLVQFLEITNAKPGDVLRPATRIEGQTFGK